MTVRAIVIEEQMRRCLWVDYGARVRAKDLMMTWPDLTSGHTSDTSIAKPHWRRERLSGIRWQIDCTLGFMMTMNLGNLWQIKPESHVPQFEALHCHSLLLQETILYPWPTTLGHRLGNKDLSHIWIPWSTLMLNINYMSYITSICFH